ncbi:MAG TPA: hypothetical protein PLZ43_12695 [bacterium]|nr:hypothetical protein [bacterium]
MIKRIFEMAASRHRGIALFISILMSLSLAVVALASMSRLSETAHQTGKSLQDRRLLMFAESASNIVSAELEDVMKDELDYAPEHFVHGPAGIAAFKFYPRDITINPGTSGRPTLFGYRAHARLFATAGMTPPGVKPGVTIPSDGACYDITIDVIEVINLPSGSVNADAFSRSTNIFQYYFGKMKTVGVISCFQKG